MLLPDFPTTELEDALRDCGFTSFVKPDSGELVELDGLHVMIQSLTSPTDGPIGDSSLWLSDGTHRVLNQNDARPSELDAFKRARARSTATWCSSPARSGSRWSTSCRRGRSRRWG